MFRKSVSSCSQEKIFKPTADNGGIIKSRTSQIFRWLDAMADNN
jgi:hypothetical protein